MNKRKCCFILLFVFVGAILSAPLCAQTVSTEDFSTYTKIPNTNYEEDNLTVFSASGITWTSSTSLSVSNYYYHYIYRDNHTWYSFSPIHACLNLPYSKSVSLTSSHLTNVSSIKVYMLRAADYEDNSLYLSTSPDNFHNSYNERVASMPASAFTAVVNSQKLAEAMGSNQPYDSSKFSCFEHTFEPLFTGYLRVHFPINRSGNNTPYIYVSEISVTHNVPDPADCTNCFQVNF